MAGRFRTLIVLLLALVWVAAPLAQAGAASVNASVRVNVKKPVQLTTKQSLDFGTILLGGGTATTTITLAQNGTLTCPAPVTCSGTPVPGILNVAGSQGQVVLISAPAVDLTNPTGAKLRFSPIVPGSITLTNSGVPGTDFNMGGSITVAATTADGIYTGVVTVTADYQ